MSERKITVRLTHAEILALRSTVTGELESLTQQDEDSGIFDDLSAAAKALDRAWTAQFVRGRGRRS